MWRIRHARVFPFLKFGCFLRSELSFAEFSRGVSGRLRWACPAALRGLLVEHDQGILAVHVRESFAWTAARANKREDQCDGCSPVHAVIDALARCFERDSRTSQPYNIAFATFIEGVLE